MQYLTLLAVLATVASAQTIAVNTPTSGTVEVNDQNEYVAAVEAQTGQEIYFDPQTMTYQTAGPITVTQTGDVLNGGSLSGAASGTASGSAFGYSGNLAGAAAGTGSNTGATGSLSGSGSSSTGNTIAGSTQGVVAGNALNQQLGGFFYAYNGCIDGQCATARDAQGNVVDGGANWWGTGGTGGSGSGTGGTGTTGTKPKPLNPITPTDSGATHVGAGALGVVAAVMSLYL